MTSKTLVRIALTLGLCTLGSLAPVQTAQAQVSANDVNVLCVWEPVYGDYAVMVYRQPGNTLVHTLPAGDPKAQQMCTNFPGDLTNWIWNDLLTNGTAVIVANGSGYGGANDQFDTANDVFCPDPIVGPPIPINPRVIGSVLESTAPPNKGVPEQTSAVVNYECPRAAVVHTPPPAPTTTYTAYTCDDGFISASAAYYDNNAITLTQTGPAWQASASSVPIQPITVPSGLNHCDAGVASVAESFLQDNVGLLNPHDFGVDIWNCRTEDLVVTVDTCDVQGNVSTYGYQLSCCDPCASGEAYLHLDFTSGVDSSGMALGLGTWDNSNGVPTWIPTMDADVRALVADRTTLDDNAFVAADFAAADAGTLAVGTPAPQAGTAQSTTPYVVNLASYNPCTVPNVQARWINPTQADASLSYLGVPPRDALYSMAFSVPFGIIVSADLTAWACADDAIGNHEVDSTTGLLVSSTTNADGIYINGTSAGAMFRTGNSVPIAGASNSVTGQVTTGSNHVYVFAEDVGNGLSGALFDIDLDICYIPLHQLQDEEPTWDEGYNEPGDWTYDDIDGDGLPDGLEGDDVGGPAGDVDGDGLTNEEEANLGTDPFLADTDGDGLLDGE